MCEGLQQILHIHLSNSAVIIESRHNDLDLLLQDGVTISRQETCLQNLLLSAINSFTTYAEDNTLNNKFVQNRPKPRPLEKKILPQRPSPAQPGPAWPQPAPA